MKIIISFILIISGSGFNIISQSYQLKYNFQQGEEYRYYQETNMVITQTIGGNEQEVKNDFKGVTKFTLLHKDGDNFLLGVSIESMVIHIENEMFTVDYDSSLPLEEGNLLAHVYQRVLGKEFTLKIDPYGKVLEVEGIDQIISDAANDIPDLSENARMQLKSALEGHIGKEALSGNMEMLLAIYPKEDKKVGDGWTTSNLLNSVVKAQLNNTWTLVDDKDNKWILTGKGTVSTTGEKSKMNGVDVNFKLQGIQDSKIVMNQKDGWFEEASQDQKIEGAIEIKNGSEEGDVMEIPIKVISTTKLERR